MALSTLSTPEDAIPTSGTGTPTAPEKSALTPPSSILDKVRDTHEPLPTTTMAITNTPSSTTVTPRATVLSTATAETQEKDTAAVPPTLATTPTTSKPPDTHSTVAQTPSQPAQTGSSVGTGTAQSPEHSTGLVHSASETTKFSPIIGTSPAPANSSQSSGPGGGACALDEYLDSTRGCMCNHSYYSHLELSRDIGTLRCKPQVIEVALRSCFLKLHHWVLKKDVFSKCSSTNTIEQGHRVQVLQLEKEGTCGLHISTNVSHALHSVHVHLEQAYPGSGSRVLHFSCAYPLVVNVSKPVSYQEAAIPTVHVLGTGETAITLSIFTDPQLHRPLQDRTAPVGMPLYVVLKSPSSDPDRFALVANEVFASSNLSYTVAKTTYHFVNESCPVRDRLLQDLNNGASIQVTLAFTLLRFLNSDTLYLHAQVTLCDKKASCPCQPSCSGKNSLRRNSPWDSGVGTRLEPGSSKWIVFGPLRISGTWTSVGHPQLLCQDLPKVLS
ncbi:UMOD [Lemmus lemmus]